MNTLRLLPLQTAAVALAVLRGVGEFALLQGWRVRDRLSARRG